MYVQCTIQAPSSNNGYRGKAISITHSECVFVTLVMQHAKRMHPSMFSFVACPALVHVSTLFHKLHLLE